MLRERLPSVRARISVSAALPATFSRSTKDGTIAQDCYRNNFFSMHAGAATAMELTNSEEFEILYVA